MKNRNTLKKVLFIAGFAVLLLYSRNSVASAGGSDPILWWDFNNQSEVTAGLVKDRQGNYNAQNSRATWTPEGYAGGGVIFGNYFGYGLKVGNIPEMSNFTETFRMKTDGSKNAADSMIIFYNDGTINFTKLHAPACLSTITAELYSRHMELWRMECLLAFWNTEQKLQKNF